jgi:hypothetical protein
LRILHGADDDEAASDEAEASENAAATPLIEQEGQQENGPPDVFVTPKPTRLEQNPITLARIRRL